MTNGEGASFATEVLADCDISGLPDRFRNKKAALQRGAWIRQNLIVIAAA
jgi:hypothetical protein